MIQRLIRIYTRGVSSWYIYVSTFIRCPILRFPNSNQSIYTTKVIEIISESTYIMIYAPRIPTFLKLNAVGFNLLLVEQVVYVYCKCHYLRLLYFKRVLRILGFLTFAASILLWVLAEEILL